MPICKSARIKIKRADKHISELETCVERLKERLRVTAHVDSDSGCEYIECGFTGIEQSEIVEDFSVIIGDVVHNLKCALDHVWFETVVRLIPSAKWRRTMFPIHPTRNDLERALRNLQIHLSTPSFFNFLISNIKPYDGGDLAIRLMHKLDTRDKHRLLIPAIHYSSIGGICLEDQYGEFHKGFTSLATIPFPHFLKFERGLHIKDPGNASFNVEFEDDGGETIAAGMLRFYSQHILEIVKLFEEFVEL